MDESISVHLACLLFFFLEYSSFTLSRPFFFVCLPFLISTSAFATLSQLCLPLILVWVSRQPLASRTPPYVVSLFQPPVSIFAYALDGAYIWPSWHLELIFLLSRTLLCVLLPPLSVGFLASPSLVRLTLPASSSFPPLLFLTSCTLFFVMAYIGNISHRVSIFLFPFSSLSSSF